MKSKYPQYYSEVLQFNSVLSTNDTFESKRIYFEKHHPLNNFYISPLVKHNVYNSYEESFIKEYLSYYKSICVGQVDFPSRAALSCKIHLLFLKIHFREQTAFTKVKEFLGMCIPGIEKILVDASGEYYPCDKMLYQRKMVIGNSTNNISLEEIRRYREEMIIFTNKYCNSCWAYRLCTACYKDIYFSSDHAKSSFCKNNKMLIASVIKTYTAILMENPKAFSMY